MRRYTLIFFYSGCDSEIFNIGSLHDAIAIEAGVLKAWYKMSMTFPIAVRKTHLTGMVIIDNKFHTVIENTTYVKITEKLDIFKERRK